jgi:aryl-phospho-beta-D-glucosidase BglC (GH1 family)
LLDFHAAPGSQVCYSLFASIRQQYADYGSLQKNGLNHSGKMGSINFLSGGMGIANVQRTLNYLRALTDFVSQPHYVNVVPMLCLLNEPMVGDIGMTQMKELYVEKSFLLELS